jgi:PBP4 family serine-type D-alanyl-D-alanine carboxypeptidase
MVQAQSADAQLSALLRRHGYESATVGVYVADAQQNVVVTHHADSMFIPASVTKCVTGALAYEYLGPEFTFATKVFVDKREFGDSGVVNGNVFVRGGGDPGFTAERLWLFVQHLYHRGIRTIKGDLVLDGTYFDTASVGPGFDEECTSRAYNPAIGALSASFNAVAVHQRPGSSVGSPVHIDIFPPVKNLRIVSNAKTLESGKANGIDVNTEQLNGKTTLVVYGGMGKDAKPKYTYRKVWETEQHFGSVLGALFDQAGIRLVGSIKKGPTPKALLENAPFYSFESEPVNAFVRHMFKYSSNFAAEMVFKALSAEHGGGVGSWDASALLAKQWWKQEQLPGVLDVHNGSGMGKINQLSARQVGVLLDHVYRTKSYYPDYCSALSTGGIDGTLKDRFERSPLKGLLRAKTGTLNSCGASTLAGYVLSAKGPFVFAILINNSAHGQYDHWVLQQDILETFIPAPSPAVVHRQIK